MIQQVPSTVISWINARCGFDWHDKLRWDFSIRSYAL